MLTNAEIAQLILGGQHIAGDQNNNFGSVPRPYRALENDEVRQVLGAIRRATVVERRKLFAARALAIVAVGYVLMRAADSMPRNVPPSELWSWAALLFFAATFAWYVIWRWNPFGEDIEDWKATVAELRVQRRVVLAEIAIRRVELRWPSHSQELRMFLFGGDWRLGK